MKQWSLTRLVVQCVHIRWERLTFTFVSTCGAENDKQASSYQLGTYDIHGTSKVQSHPQIRRVEEILEKITCGGSLLEVMLLYFTYCHLTTYLLLASFVNLELIAGFLFIIGDCYQAFWL